MPKVTYIDANGVEYIIDVTVGQSVMDAAVKNNIQGIIGDCGGACACGTCHVYVDDAWIEKLVPAETDERELLGLAACPAESGSRLSCQIKITSGLEGLVVRLPEFQG
jgi:2Fe-2S ferredoxin